MDESGHHALMYEEVVSQEEGEREGAAGGEGGGCHELLRERSVVSLGLRSVDIPRISIGPAGYRSNRD